jgi:hypothetical protein
MTVIRMLTTARALTDAVIADRFAAVQQRGA